MSEISIDRSPFTSNLGFELAADKGVFATLTWEDHQLYLDQQTDLGKPPKYPQANVRIMAPDVDRVWSLATQMNATVLAPIEDREYGVREFTILDPDGF